MTSLDGYSPRALAELVRAEDQINEEYSSDELLRHERRQPIRLTISPMIISKQQLEYLETLSRLFYIALEKVIASEVVRSDDQLWPSHRGFFSINRGARRYPSPLFLARFDYILDSDGEFKLLEFNTACPAGTCFFHYWRRFALGSHPFINFQGELGRFPLDNPIFLARKIAEVVQKYYNAPSPLNIVLATDNSGLTLELPLLARSLVELGHVTSILPLERLKFVNGRLRNGYGDPINLIYCKCCPPKSVLTGWSTFEFEQYADFLYAAANDIVCILNPLPSQTIGEDKAMLAFLRGGLFDKLLTGSEIKAISQHIPETVVLSRAVAADFKGSGDKHLTYVLKPRCESRGALIKFGKDCSAIGWKNLMEDHCEGHFLIQRMVRSKSQLIPILREGLAELAPVTQTISVFMITGEPAGVISRVSVSDIHNVGAGGAIQSIVVKG